MGRVTEREIDEMSNDGRLTAIAMRMAIDAGADWPSLNAEAQDAWHERAIERLRGHELKRGRGNWCCRICRKVGSRAWILGGPCSGTPRVDMLGGRDGDA